MEENLHNDNLESFFKKEFDHLSKTPAGDGWDTPSDEVWSGIEKDMDGEKSRFFISWKTLTIGIIFMFLLAITFYLFNKNNKLSENLRLQAQEIEVLKQDKKIAESVSRDIEEQNDPTQNPTIPPSEILEENIDNKTAQSSITNKTSILKPDTQTSSPPANTSSSQKEFAAFEENSPVKEKQAGSLIKENTEPVTRKASTVSAVNRVVPPIALPLNFINIPDRTFTSKVKLQEPYAPSITPAKKKATFFAGAYFSPNFTSNNTKSRGGVPLLFRSFEKEEWSNERGIKAGVKIGDHWTISSGIGWYDAVLTSRQIFRIEYDNTQETQVGDEFQSTYAFSVPSSYGSSEMEVDFRRSSLDHIMHGQNILLDIRTKQKLKFINIPLLVGYEWGEGKLKFGIQMGVALNILNSTVFEAEVTSRRMGFRRQNAPRITRQLTDTRKTGFDYVLSTGVTYDITPSLRFSLEPVYRKNITPVVSTEDFSNKLFTVGLHAGAYYRF